MHFLLKSLFVNKWTNPIFLELSLRPFNRVFYKYLKYVDKRNRKKSLAPVMRTINTKYFESWCQGKTIRSREDGLQAEWAKASFQFSRMKTSLLLLTLLHHHVSMFRARFLLWFPRGLSFLAPPCSSLYTGRGAPLLFPWW